MIRREDLAKATAKPKHTYADEVARRVKAGESVRIGGLGTLARALVPAPVSAEITYRLTLTAACAKSWAVRTAGLPCDAAECYAADVRHLARALGAQVEVWATSKLVRFTDKRGDGLHRITMVAP